MLIRAKLRQRAKAAGIGHIHLHELLAHHIDGGESGAELGKLDGQGGDQDTLAR